MLAREERPDLAARGEWAEAAEDEEGTKRGWGRARAGAMERDGADEESIHTLFTPSPRRRRKKR